MKCSDKRNFYDVANALEATREHALRIKLKVIAMPRLASGFDGLPWNEIQTMLPDISLEFWNSNSGALPPIFSGMTVT